MNAIVLDGGTLWLAVPDRNRTCGRRLEHNLADGVAHQLGNAASRPCSSFAQCVKLLLAKIYLRLFHMCHFSAGIDIRQLVAEIAGRSSPLREALREAAAQSISA